MIRNTAGQVVTANLINRTDGTSVTTGTTSVKVLGEGGTKAAGNGTIEHEGDGTWSYFPTQAETNFAQVTFSFENSAAIRVDVQIQTALVSTTTTTTSSEDIDIVSAANEPSSSTVDQVTVTNRSIDDLIKAKQYAAAQSTATTTNKWGMSFKRVNPGSAVRE